MLLLVSNELCFPPGDDKQAAAFFGLTSRVDKTYCGEHPSSAMGHVNPTTRKSLVI